MQYFDLRNLNYYCDAKGHLEQPTFVPEIIHDNFFESPGDEFLLKAKKFIESLKKYVKTPFFMFTGQAIIQIESYCYTFEGFIKAISSRIVSLIKSAVSVQEIQEIEQLSNLLGKCLKYLRKFNVAVNKLTYKYNKVPWISMVFQDNLLDVLFHTDDFCLFFEIISTLYLFVREEGVSVACIKISSKIREKIARLFAFFLRKEKEKVNKFYYLLEKSAEFSSFKLEIEEKFAKAKPEPSKYELELDEFTPQDPNIMKIFSEVNKKESIDLEIFDEETHTFLQKIYQAMSLDPKADFYELAMRIKLRKFKKKDPDVFNILISLIHVNIFQLYWKWNDYMPIFKENKPEFFSNSVYKDAFLLFFLSCESSLTKNRKLIKYYFETMQSFNVFSSKLSEIYSNDKQNIQDFFDFLIEKWLTFSKFAVENSEYSKYLAPNIKKFRQIINYELVSMNSLKKKQDFDNFFQELFYRTFNENIDFMDAKARKSFINLNSYLEYLTSYINIEENPVSAEFLSNLEKIYLKFLEVFLKEGENFFSGGEDLWGLYHTILGLIIYLFNHSKASFFEDLLYKFKLISRFYEKIVEISPTHTNAASEKQKNLIYFIHTVLNNSLLNVFKKINVENFTAQWNHPEVLAFMNIFQKLTIEQNLVIYRGVFINYGSILQKHVFNAYTSLEKIKENAELYRYLVIFADVYIKDFILWTVNGYNDYPSFPQYVHLLFKERFVEFLKSLKAISQEDEKTLQEIYEKISLYNGKNVEGIPTIYRTFFQFLAYKQREILVAINRLREHLVIDVEHEVLFTEEDLRLFLEINQSLQTPFSYNTSKIIASNYNKEFYYLSEGKPVSQLQLFLENMCFSLPILKDNIKNFYETYSKNFAFIYVFNSDKNQYKPSLSNEVFLDFQRADYMLGFMLQTKNFSQTVKMITDINRSEILLGFYEFSLKFFHRLDPTQEKKLYDLLEINISLLFDLYLFFFEKMASEIVYFIQKHYMKILKKYQESEKTPENLENIKQKHTAFVNYLHTKLLGKKYARKIFKKIEVFNYISSFLKHIFLWNKNKGTKELKQKLNDLILFYLSEARKKFLEKMKENQAENENFLWYFLRVSFLLSELYRLSSHMSGISESYKISASLLNENSEFFGVLADIFEKIVNLLKVHETSFKWEQENEKKFDVKYFEDYFSFAFCKYFHCNLFNEYLFPSLQTEMLNNKENIMMESKQYEQKIENIFKFIKKYSHIWLLLNKNEESIPDGLQKNYEKFYTKDPLKVNNYLIYGNKVVDFFLFLLYESKIRIRSNHIFLIIHSKLRAIPNSHKEKSVYVAYFGQILEKHFKSIYPGYDISTCKRFFTILVENQEKVSDLSLKFEPTNLESMDPIYSLCLQALFINLIARLIQNTNDKEPNIQKGVDLMFDTWDSKYEYVKYVNEAFKYINSNKIQTEDQYAIYDETVFRAKDFIVYLANNLNEKHIKEEKLLEMLEIFVNFLLNFLRIPLAKENFNSPFVRLFNENKLDFSPIILILGHISTKIDKESPLMFLAIEKILGFLQQLMGLEYLYVDNIKDFVSLQAFYLFFVYKRLVWIAGDDNFKRLSVEGEIKDSFSRLMKKELSFEEFSAANAGLFNESGEISWEIFHEICEIKENNTVCLKSSEGFALNCELNWLQKRVLGSLIEEFVRKTVSYLTMMKSLSKLKKEERKEMKKNQKFSLINHYFLLTILVRLIRKFPCLLENVLLFTVSYEFEFVSSDCQENSHENIRKQRFVDFLFEFYPYFNNAIFSFFHNIFQINTNSLGSLLKREILNKNSRKLQLLSTNANLLNENTCVFELYFALSLQILIITTGKREELFELDEKMELFQRTLDFCFAILSCAKNSEHFTLLNDMNVFYALIYYCLKLKEQKQFKNAVKDENYDKNAVNYFFNKNCFKIMKDSQMQANHQQKLGKSNDFPADSFDSISRIFEKNQASLKKKYEASFRTLEILQQMKEKKLIKQSVESFIDNNKSYPYFSKKIELFGYLKHVVFTDLHRDFFKKLKKQEIDPEITYLKKVVKKSITLFPEDLSEMEYPLKNYEERGFNFEKAEKKDAASHLQTALTESHKFLFVSLQNQQSQSEVNFNNITNDANTQKPLNLQKNPSSSLNNNPVQENWLLNNEEFPIDVNYDFELYGFPKNALSLYGVDIGIFISLPDDEKGNFLNEARMAYEEKCKEISPELIQFLYDFEGNGFPPDALLRYGIDPFYFMEMPEDIKYAILDEARKKYNQDMKNLLEKERENERAANSVIKEKILLKREFAIISEKGCNVLKEKRENLSESQWKEICEEIAKIKDPNIKANILRRLSNELVNVLPYELKKIAHKCRKDLNNFPDKTLILQGEEEEEKKEAVPAQEQLENKQKYQEELNNFFNFEENGDKPQKEALEKYERIAESLRNSNYLENMMQVSDEILLKLLHSLVLMKKKNPKKEEDFLYKTRYFIKTLLYLFKNPLIAAKLLDGMLFLLVDYEEYLSIFAKDKQILESNPSLIEHFPLLNETSNNNSNTNNNSYKLQTEELNETHNTILDFLYFLVQKNISLPLIFHLEYENNGVLSYKNSNNTNDFQIKPLYSVRSLLATHSKKPITKKNFLTLFFELLEKPSLETCLMELISVFDNKISLTEQANYEDNRSDFQKNYPIFPIFIPEKKVLVKKLVLHSHFFNKEFLKYFLRIFINSLQEFQEMLGLILSFFFDKFNSLLEETKKNIELFHWAHSNLLQESQKITDIENIDNKILLIASFNQQIVMKFTEMNSFSRALKYIFSRFRKIFKKSCLELYEKEYNEKINKQEDLEIVRSWFLEKEKNQLNQYISSLKPFLEIPNNIRFFKNIINNIDFLIEFIGNDCSQENNGVTLCYKIYKSGFKAFIYVYSFLNPLEEAEFEALEKEDNCNEVPQLSKLLTLDSEDKKLQKILHLDEVFEMLNEKFCPILDYYVKSCSNTHNNNNLSHAWRYLIQKNTNFSTLSADTKFILIKNIAKERAKKILNQANRRNTHNITVKRNMIWNSTLEKLMLIKPAELTLDDFKIDFENEDGWDAGGLKREWLALMSREIFDPDMGLFQLSANGASYQPSSLSYIVPDHLIHFRFVGRMIAKCLIENWNFGVYFPKSFLKHILKKNLNLRDLEDIDGSLARSLEWILSNPLDNLEFFFTYERKEFDEIKVFDLVKDGSKIQVTEENKREFVKIFASTKMGLEIQQQAQMLIQGIHEIIPARAISLLDEKELGLKIAGMPDINIEEMKEFAVVIEKYNNNITDWLFEILEEYDEKMRAQFLFFTSGSFRVPNEGFKKLPLKIQRVGNKCALPVAHTCFNQIDLPEYDSKEILKEKLEKAIIEGAIGFFLH